MPLPKRLVEPVLVARGTIPDNFPLPSELEAVTNGTLANTIRQLSSLSRHAEDLFGELAREAHGLSDRANSLQARIDRLAVKVTQLDSNVEEVSLQDIHMRKAFKSSVVFDQQVVSRDTMPTAMLETYHQCDTPPPLDKLNVYREDGKDGLKFYTDPNYFFDLWSQEMLKDTEKKLHDRGKKTESEYAEPFREPHRPRNEGGGGGGGRHKKRIRQPHNTRERQRQLAVGHGEYIMPTQGVQYRTPHNIPDESLLGMVMTESRPPRPNSIELRRSYPPEEQHLYSPPSSDHYRAANYVAQGYEDNLYGSHYGTSQGQAGSETYQSPGSIPSHLLNRNGSRSNSPLPSHHSTPTPPNHSTQIGTDETDPAAPQDLPPPPPTPDPTPPRPISPPSNIPPPPPPPPPPPVTNGPSPPVPLTNGDIAKMIANNPPKLKPLKPVKNSVDGQLRKPVNPNIPLVDPRNDLLKAIRDGIKLRKVEKIEQKEVERVNALNDVASILARRVAVEFSDSDSASESECDSEGWGEQETNLA
ncbi:wiskott-Aldrich syndrome protein family member 3 isoform X3 [Ceratina calcarata]|uniref:Wiskott-Aldrich syndrome protein family member n=1 Tax=Ceratina calcarata TaxID=156304 RepID=A0AAJ7J969_9HYME|nr:wiskott-Aldrich syndrome protein family member 3 isoform X3 [Ceratina calcarata]